MKPNIGKYDKTLRLIFGAVVLLLGLIFNTWWGLLGLIPIATALVNFCPLYVPFKFTTRK
ncbi:MAG TPA: DUF2892 domain-containing protein [Ignavibacteriales bacterium]|nr:DUF2892 domain-containing protein [Ignavibacteriales bacterium]